MDGGPWATTALVRGWWQHRHLATGDRAQRKALEMGEPAWVCAAYADVERRVDAGGPAAVALILALVEAAPDADGLAAVGAGPLEDLIHRHGSALARDLDRVARQHPAFRAAMATVWLTDNALTRPIGGCSSGHRERRVRSWSSWPCG